MNKSKIKIKFEFMNKSKISMKFKFSSTLLSNYSNWHFALIVINVSKKFLFIQNFVWKL